MLLGRSLRVLVYAEVFRAIGSSPPAVPGAKPFLFLGELGLEGPWDFILSLKYSYADLGRWAPKGAFCCLGVPPEGGVARPVSGSKPRQPAVLEPRMP